VSDQLLCRPGVVELLSGAWLQQLQQVAAVRSKAGLGVCGGCCASSLTRVYY
jgi:hypothetical protein